MVLCPWGHCLFFGFITVYMFTNLKCIKHSDFAILAIYQHMSDFFEITSNAFPLNLHYNEFSLSVQHTSKVCICCNILGSGQSHSHHSNVNQVKYHIPVDSDTVKSLSINIDGITTLQTNA